MARPIFPATNDSLVLAVGGYPQAGIPVKIYSRQTGGTQITDLTYVGADGATPGSAVPSGVLTSDANGLIPTFAGPDGGATTVWADHGMSGERLALTSDPAGAGGGGGAVSSVVGQTGAVTGTQILADTTVAAALALKAPLASPAFTGNPTVPTATVGDNDTTAASTAFTTAAVAVETARATTAEALAALKSANLSDLASASTARTNLGLAAAATMTTAQIAADTALTGTYGPGSDQWLQEIGGNFGFAFATITVTDTPTGLPTSGTLRWPDGTAGNFTGTIDGAANGYSGYAATWAGATTKTVTASGITYNSDGNALGPTGLVVT